MLYSVMLVSTAQQCESAISIHISLHLKPPSFIEHWAELPSFFFFSFEYVYILL